MSRSICSVDAGGGYSVDDRIKNSLKYRGCIIEQGKYFWTQLLKITTGKNAIVVHGIDTSFFFGTRRSSYQSRVHHNCVFSCPGGDLWFF